VLRDTLNGHEQAHDRGDDFGPVCRANEQAQPVGRSPASCHPRPPATNSPSADGRHVPHERRMRLAGDDDG
jgi:hypothetical protein